MFYIILEKSLQITFFKLHVVYTLLILQSLGGRGQHRQYHIRGYFVAFKVCHSEMIYYGSTHMYEV